MPTTYLTTTADGMSGGLDSQDGRGNEYLFTATYAPQLGDQVTLVLTDTISGFQTSIGGGYASGVSPTYFYTFNQRVFALADQNWYFSAIGQPTIWNDPNAAGDGFEVLSNFFASAASPQAVVQFQGFLAIANRDYCQVFSVDPDPSKFAQTQVVENMGTFAPASVKAVGDEDVFMLYDSGVRSLRVRIATNNAVIADIGTPIDLLIQQVLATLSDTQKAASVGTVDPAANRYWLYIPSAADNPANGVTGQIYVFSYFTSSQVAAWSTYSPTFQTAIAAPAANYPSSGAVTVTYTGLTIGKQYAWNPGAHEDSIVVNGATFKQGYVFTATATTLTVTGTALSTTFTGQLNLINYFVPQSFSIYKGQVWVRDTNNNIFQYGGVGNSVYENCGVTAAIPFLDWGSPENEKNWIGLSSAFVGTWQFSAASNYTTGIYKPVYLNNASTFQYQVIGYEATSTHLSVQMCEYGTGAIARLATVGILVASPEQGSPK